MIQVRAPDGSIAQFPDGTADATIRQVMARHYGAPSAQQQRAAAAAAPVVAGAGPLLSLLNGRALNFAPELMGGEAAFNTAMDNLGRTLRGQPKPYGAADTFRAVTNAARKEGDAYSAQHPLVGTALDAIGALTNPVNKLAGEFVSAAPKLSGAVGRGIATGAPIGAAYGAGAGGPGNRVDGATSGAVVGGATGAAFPAAGSLVRAVAKGATGTAQSIARGLANRGHDIDAAPSSLETSVAQAKVAQLLQATRQTPADLLNHPAVLAGKPITTAEAIGRPAISHLGALARRSGPTGDELAATLGSRVAEAPARVLGDFATAAGIHPEAAAGDIDGLVTKLQAQAKPLYDAALSSGEPVWNPDLAKLAARPVIKKAIAQVGSDMLNAGQDPTTAGLAIDPDTGSHILNPDMSASVDHFPTATTWDAVKKAVGRQIERNPVSGRPLPDSQSSGNFGVRVASQDLTHVLAGDPANGQPGAIPGYRAALDKAGDYLRMQDAFDKGAKLITSPTVNETDFNDAYQQLDEPSQQAFLGGFANKLYDMAQNGKLKPQALKAPRIADKLSTVLGPDKAADFLSNVGMEGQLAATGGRMAPGVNSTTMEFGNAAAEQEGGPNVLEFLHTLHNPLAAVKKLADAGQMSGTNPQVRAEMGRILMQNPAASADELSLTPAPPPSYGFARYAPAVSAVTASLSEQ